VGYSDGRVTQEALRFVGVHSSQLAQQQAQTATRGQAKEAERITEHVKRLEKPERIAALALLTVLGLLVYTVIQRQVRLYLRPHDQQLPGNKGETATPTAAVVLSLFVPVAIVQARLGNTDLRQVYGVQHSHLLVCDALGLDHTWYEAADSI
jgi:hypothetical protein